MDDLIDRDKLLLDISTLVMNTKLCTYLSIKNLVMLQPAVDTERHAHWEFVKPLIRKCSKCGYLSSDVLYSNCFNYCPNCGSKMDEKTEE